MDYLELSPVISALRERPADFEIDRGWLTHFPSRHSFNFDREGNVTIDARCDCVFLSIRAAQGRELRTAFQDWRATYWRPIEINREFAAHFSEPNIFQRALRRVLAKVRRIVLNPNLDQRPEHRTVDCRAELMAGQR